MIDAIDFDMDMVTLVNRIEAEAASGSEQGRLDGRIIGDKISAETYKMTRTRVAPHALVACWSPYPRSNTARILGAQLNYQLAKL